MRLVTILAAILAAAASPAADLRCGAARRVITPDLKAHGPVYLAGFGQNRPATGVHDDLFARCMALAVGKRPLVICGVDLIGLFYEDVVRIRQKVDADLIVAALHDHEGPDTMGLWGPAIGQSGLNEAYNQFVVDQVALTANEAIRAMKRAVIVLAKVHTPELDKFIDDSRPPVVHDAELIALRALDSKGEPIGVLLNWANHPEALGSRNTLITADYSAAVYKGLEEALGGTAVFINGAVGGMQSPLVAKVIDPETGQPAPEHSFRFAEIVGARAAGMIAGALKQSKPVKIDSIVFREKLVNIPMDNPNFKLAAAADLFKGRKKPNADGTSSTPVGYVRIAQKGKPVLEIALVPGELYPELSVGGIEKYEGADFPDAPLEPAIKKMMTAPYRMLFGLANDEIGYIIPKVEWDNKEPWLQNAPRRWYGEVNAVGPEAAPLIAKALADLIRGR